jgi:hypothetical protein
VLEADSGDRRAEIPAEIGRTVVSHNPFDGDALSRQPAERALEKPTALSLRSSGRISL